MPNPGMPTSGPLDPNDYESWSAQLESEPAQGAQTTPVTPPAKGGADEDNPDGLSVLGSLDVPAAVNVSNPTHNYTDSVDLLINSFSS